MLLTDLNFRFQIPAHPLLTHDPEPELIPHPIYRSKREFSVRINVSVYLTKKAEKEFIFILFDCCSAFSRKKQLREGGGFDRLEL